MCFACDKAYLGVLRSVSSRRDVLKGLAATAAGVGGVFAASDAEAYLVGASPDLILLSRTIHTMAANRHPPQAIAVRAGRIVAIGARIDILALKGPRTRVVDLGDHAVLPGFVDPHVHSNFAGLRPWLDVGPFVNRSLDDVRARIKDAAAKTKPGGWVQGKLLDPSITPGKPLDRGELDALAPDVPIFVLESNGHVAYVNTAALKIAGVTSDTPDPPQARYVRANGELTGRLEEPNAYQPFVARMPTPSEAELARFLRADMDDAAARGCTALHDCGIGGLFAEGDLGLIDAAMADNPPVRYAGFLVATHFDKWESLGLRPGRRSKRFTLNGIKAWADGSNQGRTGFLRGPYLGGTDRGALNYTPEEITGIIARAHSTGWQIGVHANGDAGIDVTLDAFEAALDGQSALGLRHRIEHCSLLWPEQIKRMAALGLSPSFLIGHVHFWGKAFQERLIGPERADVLDPCRSALAGGLRISLHSDYNVTPIDPLRCIQNAVLRDMHEGGGVLNPDERISTLEAIRAMTIDAAWQCHLDADCGSLEVGKAADFVVLEKDPLTAAPETLAALPIHSTWLDGELRHQG